MCALLLICRLTGCEYLKVGGLRHQTSLTFNSNSQQRPKAFAYPQQRDTQALLLQVTRSTTTMKFTLLTTALALVSTTLATPVPANGVNDSLQKQIQAMEITIINITNEIVQSNPKLKTDYAAGVKQFAPLVSGLQGPQPCSIFTPGQPSTKDQAAAALQKSNLALMELSLDLLNPANKVGNGAFHADVCQAWAYYNSIAKFVGA